MRSSMIVSLICLMTAQRYACLAQQAAMDAVVSSTTTTFTTKTTTTTPAAITEIKDEADTSKFGSTRSRKRAQLKKAKLQQKVAFRMPSTLVAEGDTKATPMDEQPDIRRCSDCHELCNDKCETNSTLGTCLKPCMHDCVQKLTEQRARDAEACMRQIPTDRCIKCVDEFSANQAKVTQHTTSALAALIHSNSTTTTNLNLTENTEDLKESDTGTEKSKMKRKTRVQLLKLARQKNVSDRQKPQKRERLQVLSEARKESRVIYRNFKVCVRHDIADNRVEQRQCLANTRMFIGGGLRKLLKHGKSKLNRRSRNKVHSLFLTVKHLPRSLGRHHA